MHLCDSTIWEWMADEGLEWKRQQSWFHDAEKHNPRPRGKKGSIVAAYLAPPEPQRVICLDEIEPIAVKTYPGEEWKLGPNRATLKPEYGRRGQLWVHGAFEPASGQAAIFVEFLGEILPPISNCWSR